MLRFKAVLGFDGSSRHQSAEVPLHRNCRIFLLMLRVEVIALTSNSLRLLSVQLRLIGLCPATRLTHFLDLNNNRAIAYLLNECTNDE